ncbi:aldehyde dehydrogenase family protein [Kordiimonas marina]|uniref:aldehyde dehydrogenase family protein n=1 Tax=Kordiimonas marina TaxID=2872312 RepID=UPI001FF382F4|nr:aldehyde dehydrogenase family protein [Kordiimonas marina]MCJ9427781.1 aldehyde dehydrogenase family protein [Kordiimonas marina]
MNDLSFPSQPGYSPAAQKALSRKPALFIDGEWVASTGDQLIDVYDPSTGKVICQIADATSDDVDRAVTAARRAFDDGRWTGLPPIAREVMIHKLGALLEQHMEEFAELEAIDNGKPKAKAMELDIPASIGQLHYYAGWATKIGGETIDPMVVPSGSFHAYTRREPVGVAAQIIPWNYPLIMATLKIAPALAAGCTVVLKPAEQTPLTALRLADLVNEAGFPPGVLNIITGYGHHSGAQLTTHPGVDKIAFTGSTEVGKIINKAATDTMKNVTLELGGKSPVVVFPDADVKAVAAGIAGSIFYNAGQTCIAGSRLYAHKTIFDDLMDALAEQAQNWRPGPSLMPESAIGPVVSNEQYERVLGYIDAGKKAGASVVTGGDTPSACGNGYFINPTVFADVSADMKVVREEIFGPVLVAQRFENTEEAIAAANDTPFGLGASVWTKDLSTMHHVSARIKAGTVWGNCHSVIDPTMPFGGYKESGIGREQGNYGVKAYTELKSVIIQL